MRKLALVVAFVFLAGCGGSGGGSKGAPVASTAPTSTTPTSTSPTSTAPAATTPKPTGGTTTATTGGTTNPTTGGTTTPTPKPPAPAPAPAPPPPRPTSKAGFIQLAASGPGFYSYSPATDRWGTPRMIYGMERIARRWTTERPAGTNARIGYGDVSLENGGPMPGHVSHQKGVDVDVRLARNDGKEAGTTYKLSTYSRPGTQKLVNLFRAELKVTLILFNDPQVTGRQSYPNHDDHLHVRIQ